MEPARPPRPAFAPTWHARAGRLGTAKRDALRDLLPTLPPDPTTWGSSDVAVEFGAGTGEAALELAQRRPELLVVAAEVHRSSLATLVLRAAAGPPNLQVWAGDGRVVLAAAPSASVTLVRAFFPDPWPKARHHHRRLVDPAFGALVADRLRPGGVLELATDHAGYALWIERVLAGVATLRGGRAPRADRPMTHYEARAVEAGRAVADLRYVRAEDPQPDTDR